MEELEKIFYSDSVQNVPIIVGVKLEDFNKNNEDTEDGLLRELVGGLMWL